MWRQVDLQLDAASAVSIGQRECQEDAVICDCPRGGDLGLIVLCDGMGGHAAGDVASKIVMTEVFSDLKLQAGKPSAFGPNACETLRQAALGANHCLRVFTKENPETRGMGATLVAACIERDVIHWISVGDSSLFLFRNGKLRQLNEEHSFGAQMDEMVRHGRMNKAAAEFHPDRSCLTSVISGDEISKIDCPDAGIRLCEGDIVVVASDGLQHLGVSGIQAVLSRSQDSPSVEIASHFLGEIERLADPDQDNVSVAVVKISQIGDAKHNAALPDLHSRAASTNVLSASLDAHGMRTNRTLPGNAP